MPLQEAMDHFEFSNTDNVIPLEGKLKDGNREQQACQAAAEPGGKDDPRMKEALVLMEAFLAIEDPVARKSLVSLAQQLISYDWARRVTQR
ncbi:MAG TPA: hypothetical protein VNR39_14495 [Pseudolabrys sp.]|nr:hypothetical protein [Pseudolabrys sp.]